MEKYTAVIVEPRILPAWRLVLNNFLTNLDERWDFLIVCGLKNKDYLVELIDTHFQNHKHRITLHQLNIEDFYNNQNYSHFMKEPYLYELIPTEVFLVFQLDSLISSKYNNLVYNFMKYDYVGAPINHWYVGNGGLSLRKKSVALKIINNGLSKDYNEDDYFSTYTENKPSVEEACLFSVSFLYSDICFGVHQCWSLPYHQLLKLSEHMPELFEFINLNIKK
jgi:hypothetical protein